MAADSSTATGIAARPSAAEVGDFVALMKPRVMSLVVFTALVGLVLAPGPVHPLTAFTALLCIAVGAGASGALNMWYDADIDSAMRRTAMRPIPRGRVTPDEALGFGVMLAAGSVSVMGVLVNWAAAGLLALTIGFYIVVYTMWLKRRTPQNIVIGGAAGAFPPMIGWAVVTGGVSLESAALFLIIFVWTPAHFWALALIRQEDYERAGVPMLPNVAGGEQTRRQILVYAVLTGLAGLLPPALGVGGAFYLACAGVLGAGFVVSAWRVFARGDGAAGERAAARLFGFSIVYLFALFAALLGESVAGAAARWAGV
jgi:protoheme IX farnesyltransferase